MLWNTCSTLNILTLVALCITKSCLVESKKYMRCELSKELVERYQISKTFLSNWICLIEHESERDTKKLTTLTNGSNKIGLFQISSKECRSGHKIEECDVQKHPCCKMSCTDFLNDDISDDVECAKRIFEQKGFQYWNGWSTYCRNQQNLPNLSVACNINTVTPLSRLLLL
uniref:lysozyme n=1 Tax=Glossina morsitans morsitans TaxID=37546 RepID=D3TQJ6_GLOMM